MPPQRQEGEGPGDGYAAYMPFTNRRDVELPVVDGVVQCDVEQDVLYIAR